MASTSSPALAPRYQALVDIVNAAGHPISVAQIFDELSKIGWGIGPGDITNQAVYLAQLGYVKFDGDLIGPNK